MIERTSLKLLPIVKEVLKRMIEENSVVVGGPAGGTNTQPVSVAVHEA